MLAMVTLPQAAAACVGAKKVATASAVPSQMWLCCVMSISFKVLKRL
jgi:hypothetical protein